MMGAFRGNELPWRAELWHHMFSLVPVWVTINLSVGYYNVKDGNGSFIFADDLDAESYEAIIGEWAEILFPGREQIFRNKYGLKSVRQEMKQGKKQIWLRGCSPCVSGEPLRICLRLPRALNELEMAFSFERPEAG